MTRRPSSPAPFFWFGPSDGGWRGVGSRTEPDVPCTPARPPRWIATPPSSSLSATPAERRPRAGDDATRRRPADRTRLDVADQAGPWVIRDLGDMSFAADDLPHVRWFSPR